MTDEEYEERRRLLQKAFTEAKEVYESVPDSYFAVRKAEAAVPLATIIAAQVMVERAIEARQARTLKKGP